jgi:hypothetical protein
MATSTAARSDVDHSDDSLGDSDPDPNVERNSVMRIGGIEIRMDRPGGGGGFNARRERFPPRPPARRDNDPSDDDEDEDDREGSEWGSELSLDSDAIDDYMRNCMDDDTDTDDDDADDASFDEERAADAAVAAAEAAWEKSERDGFDVNDANAREARRAAREERYLRRMRDMNLDGKEVPSPAVTDDDESDEGSSDSDDSEAENEALKSGDYGTYRWGKGALKKKGRGSLAGSLGGLPVSGKRAAKKAAKKAFKRGDSPEDFGLRRPRAVAETLAGMIRSGGAYIGFQSGMSDDALRGLLGIAHAMGLKAELRGGGKRRHAVVHWAHGARVPRDGDERLERAIASAEGEPYEGGGGGGGGGVRGAFGVKRNGSAPNFVSAGVMQNDDEAVTEGADDAGVQNKGDAFTAVDADLRAQYEEVKQANFDRTDSYDLYSKYIQQSVEELQEQLTQHEKSLSTVSTILTDGGQRLRDRIQLLKELIPIKEREAKLMMGTVDAAEVEAELAAADADMRAAEAFLNAPEAGTDGDGDGDDARRSSAATGACEGRRSRRSASFARFRRNGGRKEETGKSSAPATSSAPSRRTPAGSVRGCSRRWGSRARDPAWARTAAEFPSQSRRPCAPSEWDSEPSGDDTFKSFNLFTNNRDNNRASAAASLGDVLITPPLPSLHHPRHWPTERRRLANPGAALFKRAEPSRRQHALRPLERLVIFERVVDGF